MTRHYRHKKRGGVYQLLGLAAVQSAKPIKEGQSVVVYRSLADDTLWVRPEKEFHDGRFKEIEL